MNQVIVIVEKGNDWVEKSRILSFAFISIEVNKILVEYLLDLVVVTFLKIIIHL
jgi:hypothetical protein